MHQRPDDTAKKKPATHLTMHKRKGRDSDSQRRIFSLARLLLRRVRKINDVLGLTSPFLSDLTKQLPLTRDFVKKERGREGGRGSRTEGGCPIRAEHFLPSEVVIHVSKEEKLSPFECFEAKQGMRLFCNPHTWRWRDREYAYRMTTSKLPKCRTPYYVPKST